MDNAVPFSSAVANGMSFHFPFSRLPVMRAEEGCALEKSVSTIALATCERRRESSGKNPGVVDFSCAEQGAMERTQKRAAGSVEGFMDRINRGREAPAKERARTRQSPSHSFPADQIRRSSKKASFPLTAK